MLKYHVTRVIHGFGTNYCYLLVIFRSRQKSCILADHPQSCETACPQQKIEGVLVAVSVEVRWLLKRGLNKN